MILKKKNSKPIWRQKTTWIILMGHQSSSTLRSPAQSFCSSNEPLTDLRLKLSKSQFLKHLDTVIHGYLPYGWIRERQNSIVTARRTNCSFGYWPRSFFIITFHRPSSHLGPQNADEFGQYPAILMEEAWSITHMYGWRKLNWLKTYNFVSCPPRRVQMWSHASNLFGSLP